jgi:hypothetical protein
VLVFEEGDLLVGPGEADDFGTRELRNLADDGPDCTGRSGDDDRIVRPRLEDFAGPEVAGQSRHAEDAERGGDGCEVGIDLLEFGAEGGDVVGPFEVPSHDVPLLEASTVGFDDFADDAALKRVADLPRFRVGFPGVHPAAHVGVHGEVQRADECLARSRFRDLLFDQFEGVSVGCSARALRQQEFSIRRHTERYRVHG